MELLDDLPPHPADGRAPRSHRDDRPGAVPVTA